MQPKCSPAGDRALLVEVGEITAAHLHAAAVAVRSLGGVVACIVGQESLYVIFDRRPQPELVLRALAGAGARHVEPRRHAIEISFAAEQAPDLRGDARSDLHRSPGIPGSRPIASPNRALSRLSSRFRVLRRLAGGVADAAPPHLTAARFRAGASPSPGRAPVSTRSTLPAAGTSSAAPPPRSGMRVATRRT